MEIINLFLYTSNPKTDPDTNAISDFIGDVANRAFLSTVYTLHGKRWLLLLYLINFQLYR